ncbi:MAG: Stp1/IreP family PP2C-type Ser/Thr phosphatase, partial [Polyangiales bacterium]
MSGERTDIAETIHPAQTPMSQTATPAPDRAAAVRDADDGETRGNAGSAASAPTSVGEMAGNKEGDAPPQGSEARPDAVSRTAEAAPVLYHAVGLTNVGLVREHNEDNLLLVDLALPQSLAPGDICPGHVPPQGLVLAVCDGMGGAAAGEVASQMAVDTIHTLMREGEVPKDRDSFAQRLVRAIRTAGFEIHEAARSDRARRGMGTTATVAALIDAVLFVGQVGDSRAYVWRDAELTQITKDQSLVNQLIEAGQLTEAEAEAFEHSNIILQALGTTEDVNVDLTFLELRRGDTLLLCSDGLTGMIGADAIHDVLQHCDDLHQAGTELIRLANEGGGHDNITVILARFDGESLRPVDADARVAYQQYPLPLDAETGHDATRPVALATRRSRPTRDAMPIVTLPGTSAVAGPPRSHGVAWRHTALALLAAAAAGALLVYGVGPARLWSWLFWRSNTDH